jgi:hypothetical protein
VIREGNCVAHPQRVARAITLILAVGFLILGVPAYAHESTKRVANPDHCTIVLFSKHVNGVEMWGSSEETLDGFTPRCDWVRVCLYASADPQYQSWLSKCVTSYSKVAATSIKDCWARNSKHFGKGEFQATGAFFGQLSH